jgi:hypothetical protein
MLIGAVPTVGLFRYFASCPTDDPSLSSVAAYILAGLRIKKGAEPQVPATKGVCDRRSHLSVQNRPGPSRLAVVLARGPLK